ncbi:MAG: hypothetical protein ACRECZ_01910 [Methylocella sp.]
MAINVRPRPARRTREGGMPATLSGLPRTLVAAAKKSLAAIPVTAGLRARDFSPISLIAFLVFALGRPYRGIIQVPQLYIGRAVADLDPSGVGRDMMFVHDGQFGFSLFRFVARAMVALWGPAMAGEVLAAVAALAWFFAARALARQFAGGGAVWVVVIFAVLLPNAYGAPYPFGFAELNAIPRPFAEALVLAGLAALAARRDVVCLCCLVAAALLHPIMALAGFGVFAAVLGLEDKRWLWFCACAGTLPILGGALGLPLMDRLFTAVDPSLQSLNESRNAFLFPSLWPIESFPPLIVQTVTIAIAANLQQGRARRILAAIIVVGLGGIAIAAILGDWLSSLLVVQVQPWRTAWLMAAAGAMALGVCAVELWRRGPGGHMVLALLVLGWTFNTALGVAGSAAILALSLHFGAKRFAPLLKPQYVFATWIFTIVVATIWDVRLFAYLWEIAVAAPAGYDNLNFSLIRRLVAFPLCAAAVYVAIVKPRIGPVVQKGCAILLLAAFYCLWDRRPPALRMMEARRAPPDVMQLIDQRRGEVLWIDGPAEAWFILGRPQWASPLQGNPTIFSSALAAEWRNRMQVLMDLRLADQESFAARSVPASADSARLSQEGVRRLCAREDAPAWIIAPLEHGKGPPVGIEMKLWRLPEPQFQLTNGEGNYVWRRIDAFGVIACAGQAHSQPS